MRLLILKAVQAGHFKHSGKYYLLQGRWHKLHQDQAAPKGAPVAAHPHAAGQHAPAKHFTDAEWEQLKLPPENVNAGSYNKQLDKLKELSEAGHVTGILGLGYGTNTYGKKAATVANTLLSLHGSEHKVTPGQKAGEHPAIQAAPAETKPTEAGHVEGDNYVMPLDAAIAEHKDLVQAAETPTKTDDKAELAEQKAELGKMEEAKQEQASPAEPAASGLAMPAFEEGKTVTGVVAYYEKVAQKILDMAAAGDAAGLAQMKADGLQPNSKGKVSNTWKGKTANSKMLLALHAQALQQAGGTSAAEPVKPTEPQPEPKQAAPTKPPRVVVSKPKAAPAPAPATAGDGKAKLDQIPWDAQLLPDSNKNAKSHNGKVAQIKDMAYAGDVAGLEAFKAGTNTYGKKQNLLAQTALAALKEGGQLAPAAAPASEPTPAPAAAPTQQQAAGPAKPDVSPSVVWQGVVDEIEQALASGDTLKIEQAIANTEGLSSPGAAKANQYAHAALAHLGGNAQPEAKAAAPAAPRKPTFSHPAWGGTVSALDTWAANGEWGKLSDYSAGVHGGGQPDTPDGKKAKQYALDLLNLHGQGPQDGDTKQGADGMLVFKAGRWHKQAQPQAAAPSQPKAKVIEATLLHNTEPGHNKFWSVSVDGNKIKTQWGKIGTKGQFSVKEFPTAAAAKAQAQKIIDSKITGGYVHAGTMPHQWHDSGEPNAATAAPASATTPPPAPKAAAPATGELDAVDNWVQTGPQGGSNPGGRFKDPDGVEWYVKFPGDEDVAKSEVLAAKLYEALGIAGQDAKLITKGGKLGIASRWVDVKKAGSPAALSKVDGVKSGFAADAWLANWDVVGMGYDNLQVGANGKAVRVDAGGSLQYRAQGGKKVFGDNVIEIDSLRDPKLNPQASAVFGSMTDADITASVAKVLALSDQTIKALVATYGPGDAANRKVIADTLIARKANLAQKYPKAAKALKKRLDPTNLPVKEEELPKPHDFNNWLGTGKPLSSQPHVNAANMAVEQEMLALAKTGNLTKLKGFKFHAIDKNTGNATGQMVPIASHPSKHVVQLHADLVMMLDEIANPPQPLKLFQEADVDTLDQLTAAFPPKPFGTTVNSVSSNEKLGFWVVLGGAHGAAQKFKPQKVMDYSTAAIQAGYAKFKQASKLAKHFILSVQASGSYNDLFRDGKTVDGAGHKLADVAKAAMEHATTMPAGTSLYRWQNMPDDMVKKIMSAPDGTVFQATGPMCTSYHPTATSGFGQHRVVIRYAEGAKAVESFGSGGFSGEKEVTTLPNARFVILSKKMVPNEKGYGAKQRLELEVLMLPPDLGL